MFHGDGPLHRDGSINLADDDELRAAMDDALRRERFVVAPERRLRIEQVPHEVIAWEVFRGHLLDAAKTRAQRAFESWHVFLDDDAGDAVAHHAATAPLISIKFAAADRRLFVTRNILVHGWEAYESAPGVIDARPAQKWSAELVATLRLDDRRDPDELAREIRHCVFLACVGISRLPITSLESPLPAYALGHFAYLPEHAISPPSTATCFDGFWIGQFTNPATLAEPKFLEFVLRATTPAAMPRLARDFAEQARDISSLMSVFANVSFTPFTGLIENLAALMRELSDATLLGSPAIVELAARMLQLLTRHLTAYDLVNFHSFGANYPDALVLDTLLKLFVELAAREPERWLPDSADTVARADQKRSVRRALRQAWLLRKRYEGHRVPESPTSLGENQRVLPAPFHRVADEQIVDPQQRRKRLFEKEPAAALLSGVAALWQQCLADVEQPAELRELGTALFLDRPLGILKADGEVDRTPMFSYVAFSRSIAEARLRDLQRWQCFADPDAINRCLTALETMPIRGFPVADLPGAERPGVVALEDARRAAKDFVFLYTTRSSCREFARAARVTQPFSLAQRFANWTQQERPALIIRTASTADAARGRPFLTAFDRDFRPRWRLGAHFPPEPSLRYDEFFGQEFLADGLFVEVM